MRSRQSSRDPRSTSADGAYLDKSGHRRDNARGRWWEVNKVTAAKAGSKKPRRGKGRRVPKSTFVEQRTVTLDDGTTATIDLFACDGAIGIATLTETGEQQFDELARVRTQRREDKSGAEI
jgi:hypothetical protein